jgi:AcrR family transcriptional regulator
VTGILSGTSPAKASPREVKRRRVLEAARLLFETEGYQGATVRDIARQAGVSVGTVFNAYGSKGEILAEVMRGRLDALYSEFDRVVPHLRGSTADRLRTLFSIHFSFEVQQKRLFLAHITTAWDWTLPATATPFGQNLRFRDMLVDCVTKGISEGDVRPDADIDGVLELLVAAYAWTYRLAAQKDADAAAMIAAMDRQIGLIADGFRPAT